MELNDALLQVSEIRRHMARAETFRGYRALPAAVSSLVAVATGLMQPVLVPQPVENPFAYITLWVCAALVCVAVMIVEMGVRFRRSAVRITWQQTIDAAEQFLPCVIAGAALTLVLGATGSDELWLLPGLWGILFGLGVFACCRLLPRELFAVGFYYLAGGLLALTVARGDWAFAPWTMPLIFGGGQALTAVILYCKLERRHAAE